MTTLLSRVSGVITCYNWGEITHLRFVLVHPQVIIDNNQPLSTTIYHIYNNNNGWYLIIKYHTIVNIWCIHSCIPSNYHIYIHIYCVYINICIIHWYSLVITPPLPLVHGVRSAVRVADGRPTARGHPEGGTGDFFCRKDAKMAGF